MQLGLDSLGYKRKARGPEGRRGRVGRVRDVEGVLGVDVTKICCIHA